MLEDVERSLEVWISVGIIRSDAVPRQMLSGRLVEAVGQLIGQGVSVVGVGAPAGGIVPHQATAGRIDVDGYQKGLLDGMTYLAGNPFDGPQGTLLMHVQKFVIFRIFAQIERISQVNELGFHHTSFTGHCISHHRPPEGGEKGSATKQGQ